MRLLRIVLVLGLCLASYGVVNLAKNDAPLTQVSDVALASIHGGGCYLCEQTGSTRCVKSAVSRGDLDCDNFPICDGYKETACDGVTSGKCRQHDVWTDETCKYKDPAPDCPKYTEMDCHTKASGCEWSTREYACATDNRQCYME